MVPVCDKRYHIYNRFRHFWVEIKKLWNYPFAFLVKHAICFYTNSNVVMNKRCLSQVIVPSPQNVMSLRIIDKKSLECTRLKVHLQIFHG